MYHQGQTNHLTNFTGSNTNLFQHLHLQGLNIPSEILHEFEDGIIVDNTK